MILKHYLLKLIFESASDYFVDYIYHPPSQSHQHFFNNLDKPLDVYSTYEKVLITGDFNAQEGEECLDTYLYQNELKSLNKEASSCTNSSKASCIDLISRNSTCRFFIIQKRILQGYQIVIN